MHPSRALEVSDHDDVLAVRWNLWARRWLVPAHRWQDTATEPSSRPVESDSEILDRWLEADAARHLYIHDHATITWNISDFDQSDVYSINQRFLAWLYNSNSHFEFEVHDNIVRPSNVRCTMMSGNEWWNKNVFSRWRKVAIDGDDWMWTSNVFQRVAAATGNERLPMVVRRYDGTNSSSVDDDRRRWRPGRSDTGTSWYAGAMPVDSDKIFFES